MMSNLPVLPAPSLEIEIAALARAYRAANHPVMAGLNALGSGIEAQMAKLPAAARARIETAVAQALETGLGLSARLPRIGRRSGTALAAVIGAAGGAAGMAGTLAELPFSVTLILQAIRSEAEAAGFDPDLPAVRAACLQVLAAGSPSEADDGVDTAFLSARLAVSGATLEKMIATVAPQLTRQAEPEARRAIGAGPGRRRGSGAECRLYRLFPRHGEDPLRADAAFGAPWRGRGGGGLPRGGRAEATGG